ncbi:MAG TPA: indole-3-glycerol phosphate synthase TrpC [Candidatus Acidoferrales bacterium]|nr:indole-3-glycerol phosphate synthase TrpC [Candidatus Acidoferrales bacterium]
MAAETRTGTVLDRILDARRASVSHRKRVLPETVLRMAAKDAPPARDFAAALSRPGINVIAELKKASPSRGVLRENFVPADLASALEVAGAAALSVVTEEEFFQGSLRNLQDARKKISIPVLRKDFIFDAWQVWEARAAGADSFLLIVAALEDESLRELLALGRRNGMEPLVEVHTREELQRANAADAQIIGVNNRDLKTLEVNIETSMDLIDDIPDGCIAVCESGIRSTAEIGRLREAGFDAFLVGEQLMTQPDPAAALRELLGAP